MKAPVISLSKVSMGYRMYERPIDLVKETILGGVRHDTFWALRDIDLSVNEGDRLGIVGPNGAGKSTLLKIICGNLTPTTGHVQIDGRISSLLSMTPAWNEDENGVENIKYNLMLQGMARSRIPGIIEEIIDFTELGPFIYQPVKTYSTGMGARLSFAIATATDPEILVIDEVLGTGDGYFAGKATARMKEFCARGRALIFVSHSVAAVQQMCDRAIWMESGGIRLEGQVDRVIKQYELDFRKAEDESMRSGNLARAVQSVHKVVPEDIPDDIEQQQFRILAEKTTFLVASHYIRAIRVALADGTSIDLPITLPGSAASSRNALELVGTEWGRIHQKGESNCRLLARATGRKVGGRFAIAVPQAMRAAGTTVEIEIEAACVGGEETLAVEWLNLTEGKWCALSRVAPKPLEQDWTLLKFSGVIDDAIESDQRAQLIERVVEQALDDAEIVSVTAHAGDEESYSFLEREAFSIRVETLFRRRLPWADVALKLTRSDGVHAFWVSLGEQGKNLEQPLGAKRVTFSFNPNFLGAGIYSAAVHITSRFKHPDEWPYHAIYAREIDVLKLTVRPQMELVNKGLLNQSIDVSADDIEPK